MIDPMKLRTARLRRGWSQATLIRNLRAAAAAQTPPRQLPADASMKVTVSRWENGRQQPDGYLDVLCAALDTTLNEIMDDAHAAGALVVPLAAFRYRRAAGL